jgi:hypothetical protein
MRSRTASSPEASAGGRPRPVKMILDQYALTCASDRPRNAAENAARTGEPGR